MKILGIDPGIRILGYGIVEEKAGKIHLDDYGVIKAQQTPGQSVKGKNQDELALRLNRIFVELQVILKRVRPDVVVVEDVFYAKDIRATIKIGAAHGIALLCASRIGIPVFSYTPAEVKKSVTGNGRADKGQVQKMVRYILGMRVDPKPYDASDALAIAICHLHRV